MNIIYPSHLSDGDKIAILSPASRINPELIDGAAAVICKAGFRPIIMPYAKGCDHGYSGSVKERVADLTAAFADTEIKAILCSRGGYGIVHLLEHIPAEFIRQNPKWVIGFSDISALHAMMARAGVASIHGPMCKHLATQGYNDIYTHALFNTLRGTAPEYSCPAEPANRYGTVSAPLVGGNMAVLGGLCGTPWNIYRPGTILFIEDIAEPVYKIERMMYQLKLAGVLGSLAGLIVGQFTEYNPDTRTGEDIPAMIARMTAPYNYPVAFNFPVGHVDANATMIESASATLSVTPEGTSLKFHAF